MLRFLQTPLGIPVGKDLLAGVVFVAFGIGFGVVSQNYPMGRLAQMGPGYYPALLSALLVGIGIAIAVTGLRKPAGTIVFASPLAICAVLACPLVLALAMRPLGFIPAVALATFVATLAAPAMNWTRRLIAIAGLSIGCTLIFVWALGIPLPLLGSLLGFR